MLGSNEVTSFRVCDSRFVRGGGTGGSNAGGGYVGVTIEIGLDEAICGAGGFWCC